MQQNIAQKAAASVPQAQRPPFEADLRRIVPGYAITEMRDADDAAIVALAHNLKLRSRRPAASSSRVIERRLTHGFAAGGGQRRHALPPVARRNGAPSLSYSRDRARQWNRGNSDADRQRQVT